VDAKVWVEEINDELDISLPVSEAYESIGGLIIERLGRIPHPGESVYIQESHISLVVTQMLSRRIVKVKLIQHHVGEDGAEEPGR